MAEKTLTTPKTANSANTGQPRTITLPARYYRMYPPEKPLGYATEDLTLDLSETVFILVDVYGKGFDPDHDLGDVPAYYNSSVETNRDIVVNHIKPAKVAAKQIGIPAVYLCNYLAPSTTEHNEWRNMSLRTMNIDVLEAWQEPNEILVHSQVIAPEPGEPLIKKQHYSGFFETHLDSYLRELRTRNLITVGFDSRICLGTTVIDAMYRNYRVIVLRDCIKTGEYPETEKEGWANWMAVRFIESNVGYTATSEDFIRACEAVK
jgi:ureidoacrylate peracid hydrolase